jgi:hypothetical protein
MCILAKTFLLSRIRNEIIYIESKYYEEINNHFFSSNFGFWVQNAWEIVKRTMLTYRLTFFPETYKNSQMFREAVRYYLPNLEPECERRMKSAKLIYDKILSCVLPGSAEIKHGFIKYKGEEDGKYVFSYYEFKYVEVNDHMF